MLIRPKALKKGQTIGVVSPSYWMKSEPREKAHSLFQKKGYNLVFGESNSHKLGPFAGTPQQRADDINQMFSDPNIDAIICARGGYGANRALPLLDFDLIKTNPKIFMGYSDITGYLTSITQKTGLITFHGPMLTTYKNGLVAYNFDLMESVFSGLEPLAIHSPGGLPARTLKPGVAEGPLWGGNMTLLINRLGTNDQLDTTGTILFIEDIDEYFYSFDRMLVHMRSAGMFEKINGLIFGEMVKMKDEKIPFGKTTDEIILDVCGDLNIPIVSNFPCGHGKYQATLPLSLPVRMDAGTESPILTLLESPVIKEN